MERQELMVAEAAEVELQGQMEQAERMVQVLELLELTEQAVLDLVQFRQQQIIMY